MWLKNFLHEKKMQHEAAEEERTEMLRNKTPQSALQADPQIQVDKAHPVSRSQMKVGTCVICFAPNDHPDLFWIGEVTKVSKNFMTVEDGKLTVKWLQFKGIFNCLFF